MMAAMAAATAKQCPSCNLLFLQPGGETGKRPPRVEELLSQNNPLLDVELADTRQALENARAVLTDLDSKIVEARKLLDNLLSAHKQAKSHLEDLKSLIHPIRSIPNELLTEIFGHSISQERDDDDPDVLDPRAGPWLLTRVSRRWRNLAISSPRLWTYLLLDFDKHKGHISHHQCVYKLCLFIERSRGLPMSVSLGSEFLLEHHPALPVLDASIPRWRYLEVNLPRASLQRLSGNHCSMLQALSLQFNDDQDKWGINLDIFKSARAPILRRLDVREEIPWRALEHVAFPWSQITSIMSFPAFDPDGLNRLHELVNLEVLNVVAGTSVHTALHDAILLPKLRCLTITESKNAIGRSKEFFSLLATPVLSELTLNYPDESVLHFPASPLPLGNLVMLEIICEMNSHKENTRHVLDFLRLTHHVETLCLVDFNITLEFCDGLNLDKAKDGVLPCLRVLDIEECGFACTADFVSVPFFDMICSRVLDVGTVDEDMNAPGQSAVSNETNTAFHLGSWLNSEDHRGCLETLLLPRWLYIQSRGWEVVRSLTSTIELQCGDAIMDDDS